MDKSNRNKDIALMLASYIGLLLISLFVPLIIVATIFFLPLPFIIYTKKHGMKHALILFIGALVFSGLFIPHYTIPLTAILGLGGMMIGQAIRERVSPYEVLARGTAGFIVGTIIMMVLSQTILDVNWLKAMENVMDDSVAMSQSMMQQFGMEQNVKDKEAFEAQVTLMKDLLPAYFVVVAALLAWITQWLSYKWFNRKQEERYGFPPFRTYRLPNAFIFLYLIVLVIMLFGMLEPGTNFTLIVNNVLMILELLLVLHGLSFIFFLVHYKGWSNVFSILSIVLVLLLSPLLHLVRFLGIIDIALRLRDRMSAK